MPRLGATFHFHADFDSHVSLIDRACRSGAAYAPPPLAKPKAQGQENYAIKETVAKWNAQKTALFICDMWDDHWCKRAARRVAELGGAA